MNPSGLFEVWVFLGRSPLLWLGLTLLAYLGALALYRRSGYLPFLIPVLTATSFTIAVLWLTDTPYPTYFEGAKFVHFLIGPATVALAVPLYRQWALLRRIWRPVLLALLVGSLTAMVSAWGIAWALGGSRETWMSLMPKSATMPIAMALAEQAGGLPSLAAVAVAVTGIAGAIMARPLLNWAGIREPAVRGFAVGLSAHAIGTARALQVHETAGAFSALAMALNGVATALLMPLLLAVMRAFGG
ncbi:LrgB family protein [Curvibacter sp. RS43]|uniref:LrgB family protein n=1 Tax=Curvibacter microcysteis TaxID=3026419 RepID=A0ABT5MEF5_9BURK|nr:MULTISPECIES: LrgB family protein [unclassified Curvibacter]MDD0811418.1 LrgB family protein [Curvibacter sp. RS43]MDD0813481.1 LrgB family protein [Curvibacter sp. HBC28]